jgi:hypothetical protein
MVEVWISSSYDMKKWGVVGVEPRFILHPVMALLKKPKFYSPGLRTLNHNLMPA